MISAPAGALAAGAWLGPGLAALAGLLLLRLAGVAGEFLAMLAVVGLSLLAGAPVALLAARHAVVAVPLGLSCALAVALGFALLSGLDGLPLAQAVPGALAAGALCLLWVGLGLAAAYGLPPLAALAAGLALGILLALAIGGLAGAFWGLAAGAAVAGFRAAMPALVAPGRHRQSGRPILAGLALALAVLAGPLSAHLLEGRLIGATLPLLVALPGLALVALARGMPAFGLGTGLLALQALAVALGLAIGAAPAAAGLIPVEALGGFRLALLGAAFLPAFAALHAALLSRVALAPAILSALLLAVLSAGLGPLLALADPRLMAAGGFAAPVLATGFAFLLVLRDTGARRGGSGP